MLSDNWVKGIGLWAWGQKLVFGSTRVCTKRLLTTDFSALAVRQYAWRLVFVKGLCCS